MRTYSGFVCVKNYKAEVKIFPIARANQHGIEYS
jgi:hypothetical protein